MASAKDKKLLTLCLSSYDDKNLDKKAFSAFNKDYVQYTKGELTFREMIAGITSPDGELKIALQDYYSDSQYNRIFKKK